MTDKKKSAAKTAKKVAEAVPDLNDLITLQEAAEIRGRSTAAISELVRRGRLRSFEKFGRKLVSRREVEAFEDSRGWPKGKQRKGR
jgi:hypothetical protein